MLCDFPHSISIDFYQSSMARLIVLLDQVLCLVAILCAVTVSNNFKYRGADKSLAQLGRKQATATEDFDVHISYL
jgi:hypothetical protein